MNKPNEVDTDDLILPDYKKLDIGTGKIITEITGQAPLKSGEQLLKMRTDQINGMVPIVLRRVPKEELLDQFPEK